MQHLITNGPIEQNQKCLEETFVKGPMKSGPSNMVLLCRTYYKTVQWEKIKTV